MEPIPLPSHIHYELLLQLLERQTVHAANVTPEVDSQIQGLIATLRKALAQQKKLEAHCDRATIPYEYYWALNNIKLPPQES
jgi:hypothetical protein